MHLNLVEQRVRHTIEKNTTTSYGLTLVIGLPFPGGISDRIQHIQRQLEALAPDRFTWYGLDHLHATVMAPLRGRYRDWPPLQRDELPADLQDFVHKLADFWTQRLPFPLELAGVYVTPEGFVMIGEKILVQELASCLQRYPELDRPKYLKGLPVAIGFFNTERPFTTDEERTRFEAGLAQITEIPVGRMTVRRVWLVHYANRTLNRIVGQVPFDLGRVNILTVERLLRDLGITTSQPSG